MPLGLSSLIKILDALTNNPVLGHINTFGGHPVCCAAGHAAMKVLLDENIINDVSSKENFFFKNTSAILQ